MGGGPCDFSVSPSPFGLDFGTLDFGTSDSGLTIKFGFVPQLCLVHGSSLEDNGFMQKYNN